MLTKVKKWGNSASVRLPTSIMRAANIQLDQTVELREDNGRIVIESFREREYRLDDLIRDITPNNRHGEADSGHSVGREIC